MKKRVKRLALGGVVFAAACVLNAVGSSEAGWHIPALLELAVFLAAYLIVGYKVLRKAVRNIARGSVFDENFLMAIASVGAFCIGEYPEAVAVMLFYQVGELFEDFAVGKSRKSITDLMNIRPDSANLVIGGAGKTGGTVAGASEGTDRWNGEIREVDPEEVAVGDVILVRPGEKVPLDGIVLDGESLVDTAALTGESVPREVSSGSEILSGYINMNGVLRIRVTKPFGESTVSKILDLVENATMKKARTENFITRFAAVYTPIVVAAAVVLAVVPPLVIPGAVFGDWLYRALNFLVVSCPCALVISVPLSFFGGIGGASREGILVKGSSYLELMADAKIAVMDKTGTLTRGVFEVERVNPAGVSRQFLLEAAAAAEIHSSHPIALSLKRAAEGEGFAVHASQIDDVEERSGYGVIAEVRLEGERYRVAAGNGKLMDQLGVRWQEAETDALPAGAGTVVHVAVDGSYAGHIVIADQLKADAVEAVAGLKAKGVRTVMLTGDSRAAGEATAKSLGMDAVYTELLPGDKVDKVEELLAELGDAGASADGIDASLAAGMSGSAYGQADGKAGSKRRGRLVFVGDGINDAPVLARADVGIAMGGLGSDAAIEAADIVIMNDEPSKLPLIMEFSKKTMKIVRQNIVFALGVKLLVLALSAFGYANMWMAVFADVGVSMLAIMNSFRAMRVR